MPSLSEAPNERGKSPWLLGAGGVLFFQVTRRKGGTHSGRYRRNGYVHLKGTWSATGRQVSMPEHRGRPLKQLFPPIPANNATLSKTPLPTVPRGLHGKNHRSNRFCSPSHLATCAPFAQAATTLVYCSEASPAGFDPSQYTSGTDFDASAETVFNRLTQFKRGGTEVEPGLATRWDVSEDGLTYTFHLRDGVKFHTTDYFTPTRDFNADDVLFTFTAPARPRERVPQSLPRRIAVLHRHGPEHHDQKRRQTRRHTVRFNLNNVDAAFVQNLAMSFASVQSAEYAAQLLKQGKAADINQKPVGTGPFVFKRYQKDSQIRYTANKAVLEARGREARQPGLLDHPGRRRALAETQGRRMPGQRLPAPGRHRGDEKRPRTCECSSKPVSTSVSWPTTSPIRRWTNSRCARPWTWPSTNRRSSKRFTKAPDNWRRTPCHRRNGLMTRRIKDAPYDPTKARALLKEAGVAPGTTIDLWAMTVQRASNPNARMSAQMIQQDWDKVGIKANIVSYEWGEYIKRAKNWRTRRDDLWLDRRQRRPG